MPESQFNRDQVFVLVTNGIDRDTISAVQFWSKKGVRIECAPYRIYEIDGNPYIQFDTYNPEHEILLEENTGLFIVNTNKTYMPDAWQDMIGEGKTGKASAYGGRRYAICRIPRGSTVYLYHTGVGVIAKGRSTSTYLMTDCEDEEEMEFYVPLEFEWALKGDSEWDETSIRAWEINQRMTSSHRFRQTVFAIERRMANEIDSIYEEKRNGR